MGIGGGRDGANSDAEERGGETRKSMTGKCQNIGNIFLKSLKNRFGAEEQERLICERECRRQHNDAYK